MSSGLARGIGLAGVFSISAGAMMGSGIFVLPGIAASISGPAVALGYVVAGLIALTASLSQSELATAMPHAGGAYVFLERALGPLIGAIAGLGTWFALTFKSAFALVGLGAYLVLIEPIPAKPVAIVIAVALIVVNILGAKETARFQKVIVAVAILALVGFVVSGVPHIDARNFEPALPFGANSVLATAGLVFVSYIGVTNVASIAEEIEDPDKNIPRGILLSLGVMTAVYALVSSAIVGLIPYQELGGVFTAVASAAQIPWGSTGVLIISFVALIALVSMANSGLLTSARYPFAMGRDSMMPVALEKIHGTLLTPINAILLTGGLLIAFIAFFPVVELAKLASAFNILIFALLNVAVLALRESHRDWYTPTFKSPGYPWVQIAGVVASLVLITEIGLVPVVAVLAIIAGGAAWYWWYARSHGRNVTELMNREVATVHRNENAVEAAGLMEEGKEGYLIVIDEEIPIGIITERDYVAKIGMLDRQPSDVIVGDVMSAPLIAVEPDTRVGEALRILRQNEIRHLPVVSDSKLLGIVTDEEIERFFELEIS